MPSDQMPPLPSLPGDSGQPHFGASLNGPQPSGQVPPQFVPPQPTGEQPWQQAFQQQQVQAQAQVDPAEVARRRKRRRRGWIASVSVIVVLVLLIGGGFVARNIVNSNSYGPQGNAEQYLQALVDGRASDALAMLDPNVSSAERVLLSDEVYQAATVRPTSYELLSTEVTGEVAVVKARITMDEKDYDVRLKFKKDGMRDVVFDNWKMTDGPQQSIVLGYVSMVPKVNGVEVDLSSLSAASPDQADPSNTIPVLPGSYTFTAPSSTDYQTYGEDQTVVVVPNQADSETEGESEEDGEDPYGSSEEEQHVLPANAVTFELNWTQQGKDAAIKRVQEHVATCMTSDQFVPEGCPQTLEMDEPSYAVTDIVRTWKVEPQYAFFTSEEEFDASSDFGGGWDGVGVYISGGDCRIDYTWRWEEDDEWEPRNTTNTGVFDDWYDSTFVGVTVNNEGKLEIDTSNL